MKLLYNVIIVDDEFGTLESVKSYITDLTVGFNVVACFKNGREAVDYILSDAGVDVVITDIKMPVMDGMELTKWIHENRPNIKVVIISAYGDFEYARKAIRYGAFHYLLKLVDVDEFVEVMNRLKEVLGRRDNDDRDVVRIRREFFFTNVVFKIYKGDEVKSCYSDIGIPIPPDRLSCDIYEISCGESDTERVKEAVYNIYDNIKCGIYPVYLQTEGDTITFIFNYDSESEEEERPDELLGSLLDENVKIRKVNSCSLVKLPKTVIYNIDEMLQVLMSYISEENDEEKVQQMISSISKREKTESAVSERANELCTILEDVNKGTDDMESLRKISISDITKTVKEYIDKNYSEEITVKKIAESLYINAVYMGRIFKLDTGMSVKEYLNEVRCKKAIELMQTEGSFEEISYMVGYANVRHFRRTFKEITGYSPNDYKSSVLKMNGV